MIEPAQLSPSLLVAVGGGTGAWLRFQTGGLVARFVPSAAAGAFPFATLAVNVVGSLAMGVLAGWLARHGSAASESWRLLLGVGLLGGYTTFSAFSLELVMLAERGAIMTAVLYAALSLAAGIGALIAGLQIARAVA